MRVNLDAYAARNLRIEGSITTTGLKHSPVIIGAIFTKGDHFLDSVFGSKNLAKNFNIELGFSHDAPPVIRVLPRRKSASLLFFGGMQTGH